MTQHDYQSKKNSSLNLTFNVTSLLDDRKATIDAMSTAIVTGATGILGREIVTELARRNWSKVYALSRSKKDEYPENVSHSHLDLTGSAEEIAKELKGIEAEYLFFAAYLAQDDEKEATRVNGDMLANFLQALAINGSVSNIKRIVLVCGAKQYGVHLGQVKGPMEENDPWLPEPPFPQNFYYRQQRVLFDFCKEHKVDWTATYPNDVIGFAKGNFMNIGSSIAIYAAVCKELGNELPFPGSEAFYTMYDTFTDAHLHAEFCEWAAQQPGAANESFNVINGDVESWQNMWPKLAKYFGLEVPADQFARPSPLSAETKLESEPPISVRAKELGLEKRCSQSVLAQRINLVKWSQEKEVKDAWKRLAEREGLEQDALEKATWPFADFVLGRNYNLVQSMSKARRIGWTGYQDTWENFENLFKTLEAEKVLPKRR
ncbi:NAD dependent epimerase/dehydratase family protein [Paramyrothecium foliicola]|nr:NAD dependent epimerase/dehydratase family protein [Paramyrothecium foliicola]